MKIKSILIAAAAAMAIIPLLLAGCGEGTMETIRGSGVLKTRNLDYSGFTKIENGSFVRQNASFDIYVSRADEFSVSVTLDDNILRYLSISRDGKTLRLSMDKSIRYSYCDIRMDVTMPEIERAEFSGAVDGFLDGFTSQKPMELIVSGASQVMVDDIVTGDMDIDVSGASTLKGTAYIKNGDFRVSGASALTLGGTGSLVAANVDGASSLRMGNFNAANMNVRLSGACNGVIYTTGTLDVNLSGASVLDFTGDPTLRNVRVDNSSTLNKS